MDHVCMYCKAHDIRRKAHKHKNGGYKNILDRWNDDDKCRKSLSDIGWTEERILQYDEIALEDHSYVATQQERGRTEKSWKRSLNAEGIQGKLNQRSERRSKHAKDCITNFQRSLDVETNQFLQSNKSDKGLINSLKALRNAFFDLKLLHDGDTILLPQRIHLRHHDGNQAAICGQLGAGIRGDHHPGLNSEHFSSLLVPVISLRLLEMYSAGNRRKV